MRIREKNEMVAVAKEYLETAGVQVDTDLSMFNTERESYLKIDKAIVGKVDSVLQQLPQIMLRDAYSGEVYRAVYDKGLGVLQKSAQYPGMKLGNVVAPDANNHIRDVARWQELSVAPQIASSVFSAMSMITGQYFMTQINNNLVQIEKGVSEIRKFLEDDKLSKLASEEEFLQMTQKTMHFILDNEVQKHSTLASIQKIRMDSLANINFYKMQINNLENISSRKDKADDIINNVQNVCFLISEYWYSLYLYCFAVYLEPVVAQNLDSSYLGVLKADMDEKCQNYKDDYALWKQKLDEYIDSAKAFESNKILEGLKLIGKTKVSFTGPVLIAQSLIEIFANVADSVDKNNKKQKREAAIGSLSLSKLWENVEAIEAKQQELTLFDSLYNGKLEVVKEHDEMYIKLMA